MNKLKWLRENTEILIGKTVCISGATGGLGRALCFYLAELGADIITIDRNPEKAADFRAQIKARFPNIKISSIIADFEKIETVKAACEELEKLKLDYLILNSGAYGIPRKISSAGYDNVFTINFVSPYYLVRSLLPHLRDSKTRVVAVGSIAHNYSKSDPVDIDFKTRRAGSLVYGNAKRYLMYGLAYLLKNETSLSLSVVHPGISFTGITNHYPKLIFALIKHPMKLIFMKPQKACLSILKGLFLEAPFGFWIGPRVFDIWGKPKLKALETAEREETEKIFATAERIYIEINDR